MALQSPTRAIVRQLNPSLRRTLFRSSLRASTTFRHVRTPALLFTLPGPRPFQTSSRYAGIMPDTSDPEPREVEPEETPSQRTEISADEYHMLADRFLEELQSRLEQRQEEKGDVDVDYSVGTPSHERSIVF